MMPPSEGIFFLAIFRVGVDILRYPIPHAYTGAINQALMKSFLHSHLVAILLINFTDFNTMYMYYP